MNTASFLNGYCEIPDKRTNWLCDLNINRGIFIHFRPVGCSVTLPNGATYLVVALPYTRSRTFHRRRRPASTNLPGPHDPAYHGDDWDRPENRRAGVFRIPDVPRERLRRLIVDAPRGRAPEMNAAVDAALHGWVTNDFISIIDAIELNEICFGAKFDRLGFLV